jgi:hypothetical protein
MDETMGRAGSEAPMVPAPHVSWREVGGEVILLDGESGTYLNLNPVGAELWGLVSQGAAPEALAERLRGRYELDEERARADVAAFLGDLRARGLVVAEGAGG